MEMCQDPDGVVVVCVTARAKSSFVLVALTSCDLYTVPCWGSQAEAGVVRRLLVTPLVYLLGTMGLGTTGAGAVPSGQYVHRWAVVRQRGCAGALPHGRRWDHGQACTGERRVLVVVYR